MKVQPDLLIVENFFSDSGLGTGVKSQPSRIKSEPYREEWNAE